MQVFEIMSSLMVLFLLGVAIVGAIKLFRSELEINRKRQTLVQFLIEKNEAVRSLAEIVSDWVLKRIEDDIVKGLGVEDES